MSGFRMVHQPRPFYIQRKNVFIYKTVQTNLPFEIRTFLSGFRMVQPRPLYIKRKIYFIYKTVQANLPSENRTPFENRTKPTIRNPDMSGFRIPTVVRILNGQKRGWVAIGPDFEWDLKSGSPSIRNLDKWLPLNQKPFEIRTKMS